MIKFFSLILALVLIGANTALPVYAKPTKARSNVVLELSQKPKKQILSDQELFMVMVDVVAEYGEIPSSYKYIKLQNTNTPENTRLYKAYQKAVYLDILKPSQIPLTFQGQATHQKMINYTNLFFWEKKNGVILVNGTELRAIKKKLTYDDLVLYANNYLNSKSTEEPIQNAAGFEILADAYQRLMTEHIDNAKFSQRDLMYGAIEGMAKATGDQFTVFFPPAATQEFEESINGEFEGIWAILDMSNPGELLITSVLMGSPAEKSGARGGDRILKVDDYEIIKTSSIENVISRIKGPAGTSVTLTILRNGTKMDIKIIRAKIKMEMVGYKKLDSNTSLITIASFWDGTIAGFRKAVEQMKADAVKRIIIDLRNDGGGNVREVSDILDYFVPMSQNKFSMKTLASTEVSLSTGLDEHFKNKEIVILINKGTASASEIMVTAIQDYLPVQTKVIWETSYGKGSAQQFFNYFDGSSLKYTVAKWYSGKNNRSVNSTGIVPDFTVEFDAEKYRQGVDNQLEYARTLQY